MPVYELCPFIILYDMQVGASSASYGHIPNYLVKGIEVDRH